MTFHTRGSLPSAPQGWKIEHRFDAFVGWTARLSPVHAWCMIGLATALTGMADALTGLNAWFGPLYLLVICLATWANGWRAGAAVAFACIGVSTAANGVSAYPFGSVAVLWNLAMRLLAILIIIVLIGSVRRSFDREWHRARTDGLTGLLNKQAFLEKVMFARRRGGWGILAYVDLDGLKRINDQHGHAAGDEVLEAFANGVRKMIRDKDVFARIGGDEFLLFLPVGDAGEGSRTSHQLHARMNRMPSDMGVPIRCSMGVLLLAPDARGLTDADIQVADQLMYEAKRDGAALRIATGAFCRHGDSASEAGTRSPLAA